MIYVFISELKALLYFATKVFFNSIASIFFRSVEVVGRFNVPRHGPGKECFNDLYCLCIICSFLPES